MLSTEEIKSLGRIARISLGEDEAEKLCRDLNALLEMVSVLEPLPGEDPTIDVVQGLGDMREDQVTESSFLAAEDRSFSVPRVMEKG
ncbi:MAG: hypothetical protein IJX19_13700 [Clostridia bacterium]|nr:hypothetical protein [Clostridia bacterium]MBQ8441711.1 hypothetical protein [Clostridia bacterium]